MNVDADGQLLARVRGEVVSGPAVMGVAGEVAVIRELMRVPYAGVVRHAADFDEVTSALYMSHMDTYFDVDDNNIGPFLEFADWLEGLARHVEPGGRDGLESLARHFRLHPRDFTL